MKCTRPCFTINSVNINDNEAQFLKQLYNLMTQYNVHRIYSASLDKKKIVVAHQLLGTTIGNTKVSKKFFNFMDQYFPWFYFNILYKNHMFRYTVRLKRLFKKHGIEKIGISSFSLYQGIHTTTNSLCIREIYLVYKDGQQFHIENLYLNID